MSLLHFLQLQPVEPDNQASELDQYAEDETITLEEHPDEERLEQFWNSVSDDIHNDPSWFTFADDED